jgi:pimeloyl-ACP methyl ester carboxylesterase
VRADTPHGSVEYEIAGEGPPVVVVHGTPGGADQALVLGRFLVEAGLQVIAPSRPGYRETPLEGREEIDAQADLHAALLDALGIERAGVLAWSGGGPSAYRLSVRHPERVRGLVAASAVSKAFHPGGEKPSERLLFSTRAGDWVLHQLAAHAPGRLVTATLRTEANLADTELHRLAEEVLDDPDERRFVLDLDGTIDFAAGRRRKGRHNDLARYADIGSLELERIQAPCLVVHGTADKDVTPDHGGHARVAIPRAQPVAMAEGTHLCLWTHPGSRHVRARAIALLRGD